MTFRCVTCGTTILLLSLSGVAQPLQTKTSRPDQKANKRKSASIPLAPCVEFGKPKSCETFNDMLSHHDSDFSDLLEKKQTYVCFRTDVDNFFRITFLPFDKSRYELDPTDAPEYLKNSILSFDSYLNGQDNGSYIPMFQWLWVKKVSETARGSMSPPAPTTGVQSLEISESGVHIVLSFTNVQDEKVTQTIDIRRSTGRFSLEIARSGQHDFENGRCVAYPK